MLGCSPLDCAGDPVPADEVAGLRLDPAGATDLRLSWEPLAGVSGYRVWKSGAPQFGGEAFVGETTTTELIEAGGHGDPATWYYLVRGTNSCEWEGP